jgi:hypothetical protein
MRRWEYFIYSKARPRLDWCSKKRDEELRSQLAQTSKA